MHITSSRGRSSGNQIYDKGLSRGLGEGQFVLARGSRWQAPFWCIEHLMVQASPAPLDNYFALLNEASGSFRGRSGPSSSKFGHFDLLGLATAQIHPNISNPSADKLRISGPTPHRPPQKRKVGRCKPMSGVTAVRCAKLVQNIRR